ncbi:hypothetical protein FACS1894105_05780 [Clostridia bacterium]|nr:hypothetical protein FACS1894105_05780 [Clostridia bacterium]
MKINWKQKLSSRKFWAAIGAFVTAILSAIKVADTEIAAVTLIISGIGALAVYMLAEGIADNGRKNGGDDDGN